MDQRLIRNFSIIAHIDHGKSTLADRLIEIGGNITQREFKDQFLDSMSIERERGITIKAQTVRLQYKAKDGITYILNLMDTPGHVDFAYEVSRSLAACEGSILIVDASQGIEAQTIANTYHAIEADHIIIPVLNKIDLPHADPEKVLSEIKDTIGLDKEGALNVSAKQGIGIIEVLEAIVTRIPCPTGNIDDPLQAILVDSWYDEYLGVVMLVRIKHGIMLKNMTIRMMANDKTYTIEKIGVITPKFEDTEGLNSGEIGFIVANIKSLVDCHIGDTITDHKRPALLALPGFREVKQVVFSSIFPKDNSEFDRLRISFEKLHLNDSSFSFAIESSAFGLGFRCGFLGMLHMEVIKERIRTEYKLTTIATAPNVIYKVVLSDQTLELHNANDMPERNKIIEIQEPWLSMTLITKSEYIGNVITLCEERRGIQKEIIYSGDRSIIKYDIPLNEVMFDFHDKLKSISRGYASMDYEISEYRAGTLVKVDILLNGEIVEPLSFIVHRSKAESTGRAVCERIKNNITRQQFKIIIQAAIGGKIIARETINPFRKDVTAKLYGGDVTRKKKLLEKQKIGKKKMHDQGNIKVPHTVVMKILL